MKTLPTNESPRPDGFTSVFYQTPRKELTLLLLKLFQKLQSKTLPHSFYKASITQKVKPDIPQKKKKNYRPISLMNTKILNNKLAT